MDDETEGVETSLIQTKPVSAESEPKSEPPERKATTSNDNKRKADHDITISPAKKVTKVEKDAKVEKITKVEKSPVSPKSDITGTEIPTVESIKPKVITNKEKSKATKPVNKESNLKSKESSSNTKKPVVVAAAKKAENNRRSTSKPVETGSAKSTSTSSERLSRSQTRHVITRGQKGGKKQNVPEKEKRSLRHSKRK